MALLSIGNATEYSDASQFLLMGVVNNGSNCFQVPSTGGWKCVLNIAGGMLVSVVNPPVTAPRSVVRIRIEQDGTGGRTFELAPSTIYWRGGTQPVLASAANSWIQIRLTWLGSTFGWFGEQLP